MVHLWERATMETARETDKRKEDDRAGLTTSMVVNVDPKSDHMERIEERKNILLKDRAAERNASGSSPVAPLNLMPDIIGYQRDLFERAVLFWDTLRQRADNMIAHERAGKPPLLDFDYEMLADARRFEHPANYALLRITRVGDHCLEDCLDETKPSVIVVDPRAGHGPGIGGFKRESEVGMAMHEGYPVYHPDAARLPRRPSIKDFRSLGAASPAPPQRPA